MPDGDVINKRIRYAWRNAFETLRSGANDAVVPGAVARSITAAMRQQKGIPALGNAAALVSAAWTGQISREEGLSRASVAVGSTGGTRTSALLERAVQKLLVTEPTNASPDVAVAEAYIHTLVDAELMAKLRPALLEAGDRDPVTVEHDIGRWMESMQEPIRGIARQVATDPSCSKLRAPPSRSGPRKSTAELLDESVT